LSLWASGGAVLTSFPERAQCISGSLGTLSTRPLDAWVGSALHLTPFPRRAQAERHHQQQDDREYADYRMLFRCSKAAPTLLTALAPKLPA
jgi:hypothetical protein